MEDADFDRVLGLLMAWQGHTVVLGVDVTEQPLEVARMRGTLAPAADIADPYDHEEFEFSLGEGIGFALRRDYFAGANYFPDSGHLIVHLSDAPGEDDEVATIIHIVSRGSTE